MALRHKDILNEIEGLVRQGKGLEAASRLRKLNFKKIPTTLCAQYASLARRTLQFNLALKILAPVVRPFGDWRIGGSSADQVEYAAALIKIGATLEGIELLQSIQNIPPEGLLYEAFGHVARWDYQLTIPILTKYCQSSGISPYQRLIGQTNLAAALVFEKDEAALKLLDEIIQKTESYLRLRGHAYHLKAQCMIRCGDFHHARKMLLLAKEAYKNVGAIDLLYVQKWEAVIEVLKSKGSSSSLAKLERAQKESLNSQHWESVRDCELYKAIGTGDEALIARLLVGSPFPAYRNRIISEFGRKVSIPEKYLLSQQCKRVPSNTLTLLTDGRAFNGKALKLGQTRHRLLVALASDFFKPFNISGLHSLVYSNETYNPINSATRIYQAIKRCRGWLNKNAEPVDIQEMSGSYKIVVKRDYALEIPSIVVPMFRWECVLEQVRHHYVNEPFTTAQAQKVADISPFIMFRAMKEGVQKGIIEKINNKPPHQYCFIGTEDLSHLLHGNSSKKASQK